MDQGNSSYCVKHFTLLKFLMGVLEFQLIAKNIINRHMVILNWCTPFLYGKKNKIGNVQNQVRIVNEELLNVTYPFIQLLIHSA